MGDTGGSTAEGSDRRREMVAALLSRLPPAGTPTDKTCAGCGDPIGVGQHYLRVAVMFDTAGLEPLSVLALPEGIVWSAICDDPMCAGLALMRAGQNDPLFTDVFRR